MKRLYGYLTASLSLIILAGLPLVQRVHANESESKETFSPTVKIVAYKELLNRRLIEEGFGSGTFIDENGLILTNAHVIMSPTFYKPSDAFAVCVSQTPQEEPDCRFTASVVRYDESIDLALLQINPMVAWGALPEAFPNLSYQNGLEPMEGEKVVIYGFPASGGLTINSSQGQVSGFEEWAGYTYLKTDADIDAGNSGGTMLNENGEFIGIPTYVVSYYENVGRALHVNEVEAWMASGLGIAEIENKQATETLNQQLKKIHEANTSQTYTYTDYPKLSMNLPEGWQFDEIETETFTLHDKNSEWAYIQGQQGYEFFEEERTLEDDRTEARQIFGDYQEPNEEIINIGGVEGVHLWSEDPSGSYHVIYARYGYAYLILNYAIPANNELAKDQIETFLKTLKFNAEASLSPPRLHKLSDPNYPFVISVPDQWAIEKENTLDNFLAYAQKAGEAYASLSISYGEVPDGIPHFIPEEGLQNDLNFLYWDETVTFQTAELMVDGLPGWMYVSHYEYDGERYHVISVTLQDPDYEIYLYYEADEVAFENGFEDFSQMLKNFKTKRYVQWAENPALGAEWESFFQPELRGTYHIPTPPPVLEIELTDIEGHRFEESIQNLVAQGVIQGYPNKTFDPEGLVNRAAALKMIFASLNKLQSENGSIPYQAPENFDVFKDVSRDLWYFPFVAEGYYKGIVKGYPDGTFRGEESVILAEALKMALEAYRQSPNVRLWSGETTPWYKKYFDAAYSLYLLPQGFDDPKKELTRAEMAHLIDQLMNYWPMDN